MIINKIRNYLELEDGATAIEYALIAGLLSILIIAGLIIAGPALSTLFENIGTGIATATS